jgi:beta-fructofuranosidase
MKTLLKANLLCLAVLATSSMRAADDILIADFEGDTYAPWTATGEAFGPGPAKGTLPGGQMSVTGFRGKGLANSYFRDDNTTGTLTSPEFRIERKFIAFLIGGGRSDKLSLQLLVDGKVVRSATGTNDRPGGSEMLWAESWDVAGFAGKTARLRIVDDAVGGWGHVLVDHIVQTNVKPAAQAKFPSPVPQFNFASTLPEQEAQLKTNALMRRFAESRRKLAGDKHRPLYHFVSPESTLNDPNGLCFWQGRWHLFYQAYPPEDTRQHWGHIVSDDLVHWRDLPYAIYPGIERMCFSGSTVVEDKQVVAFYPGVEAGMMVAISRDPLLLNWEKLPGNPVFQPARDSCIWKQGDTYFGLLSGGRLLSSTNLADWKEVHANFMSGHSFPIDDGSCPNFVPIGDKHLLLLFSHTRGGQYLLGDYNPGEMKFAPYNHGRFNHGLVAPAGVHAPSAASDGQGGVINILNINEGKAPNGWDHIFSLAQRLTLGADKRLRIEPVAAVASMRGDGQHIGQTAIPPNQEIILEAIKGDTMELDVEIDSLTASWVQLNVLRSPNAEEQTSITFHNYDRYVNPWFRRKSVVSLDGSRSSTLSDVIARPPETAEIERGSEPLRLRVFLDRSVVEVFVNGKLYLAERVYPGRPDSLGVSLRAQGQGAVLKRLDAWPMKSIWP